MIAVITGDIINSRQSDSSTWQSELKAVLSGYGAEPGDWEIFRGDSFQLALPAAEGLLAAIHLKAAIKQVSKTDVRIGIGLGERDTAAGKITEATGTAFIRSGDCFDGLKKNTMAIASGQPAMDETLNTMLVLATLTMDNWSETVATLIRTMLEQPELSQQEIAQQVGKSQSTISETLKRGGYDEIKRMENYYRMLIQHL